MKYLLVSNMYPKDDSSGYGVFIKNIKQGLELQGVEVDIIAIKGKQSSTIKKIFSYIKFYFTIISTDFKKYNFIQISYPSHTYIPFLLKRKYVNKFIVRLHGHDLLPINKFGKLLNKISKKAVLDSPLTILPSKYFYNELLKLCRPNLVYIYPSGGLDKKLFYFKKRENKVFTIGYVGRIVKNKGLDLLLKAVSKLNFDYQLIIIGRTSHEPEYFNNLELLVRKLKINNKVKFMGFIRPKLLIEYYSKMNLFVFPTQFKESFGNVAIEAMACGVPVVGSKIGALEEYIFHEYNGYLFEPNNIKQLQKFITKYYELNNEERLKFINNAIESVKVYEQNYINKKFYKFLKNI